MRWELIGLPRRDAFVTALRDYVRFYLEHMKAEEMHLLPAARGALGTADWAELDAAFVAGRDPLAGGAREAQYEKLFTRVVMAAPAPIGVGAPLHELAA